MSEPQRAGWYRVKPRPMAMGEVRRAHWIEKPSTGRGSTLCNLSGRLNYPGMAPHCKTCEKRLEEQNTTNEVGPTRERLTQG